MNIIPAILPQRFSEIENGVEAVFPTVSTIQIDVVDGVFAPNKTWWFNRKDEEILGQFEREERGLPHWQEVDYELDLMIRDPLRYMDDVLALGPSKIIFHLESFKTDEMLAYFQSLPEIVKSTVSFGMAISIGTPPEDVEPFKDFIDTIQCMGISNPGFQGEEFNVDALAQIRRACELYPNKTISVDGGMNHASLRLVAEAGATAFVVGSTIFGSDNPRGTIRELKDLCKQISRQENLN